jgi:hypothetical protein
MSKDRQTVSFNEVHFFKGVSADILQSISSPYMGQHREHTSYIRSHDIFYRALPAPSTTKISGTKLYLNMGQMKDFIEIPNVLQTGILTGICICICICKFSKVTYHTYFINPIKY